MDSQHLLVPIKVQALVIDDIVIDKSGAIEFENRYVANDGRWSPQLYNYQQLVASLRAPGPRPFYGATRQYQGRNADQLVLDPVTNKDALPKKSDRGVYLHWVMPSGLRRAYTPGQLDFPPLPDHWLIVRFSRSGANLKSKAWFIDGGAIVDVTKDEPANLLFAAADKYVAKRVGRVVPLEEFATADSRDRTPTITAVGNDYTGSPTFTASIAENRNIFSWHDKLDDLRSADKIPENTTLTYCVLGWYRDQPNDPLSSSKAKVVERRDAEGRFLGWLIDPPGWSIDANSTAPVELLKRRSVFHGMVAHINYWSGQTTYKGHMLGYPGAPLVGGAMGGTTPAFKVGVGNSAEDALVSLVSSEYSGEQQPGSLAKEQPNLWKALEAVMYRQAETLVRSWNVSPRDMTVHQNSFATHEAGKFWYIRPLAENRGTFPADADKTADETGAQPTAEQLAKLKDLNQLQAEADTVSRDLAALQQDLYARWWKLCSKSRTFDSIQTDLNECTKVAGEITQLRDKLNGLTTRLAPLPDELKAKLAADKLELKYDAAPRFWLPADPVIIVKNSGSASKHQFPRQHPCRLPEQIITSGKVKVKTDTETLNAPAGVADIAAAATRHLPSCPAILNALLNEASIVEQTVRNLVERSLPAEGRFPDQLRWSEWTKQLVHDLAWDGDNDSFPRYPVTLEPEALKIRPSRLVDLWVQQPWSPLFIDWQITWFPTDPSTNAEQPFGPVWKFGEADFVPSDIGSIPQAGHTVRGRSLLSPIDERIFEEPIDTLGKLLDKARTGAGKDASYPPAVIDVLERYEVVWSKTLKELPRGGLMGQALTGFHQALLRRDVTFPRITPDSSRPWIKTANLKTFEDQVRGLLGIPVDGVSVERLAPPSPAPTTAAPGVPFSLIRAGALRIDELWLVDDFGQSADLLGLTAARSTSSAQVFHPRMRWHDHPQVFAMPPRVLQPVRLNFRFTPSTETELTTSEPALNSICGWIFYNQLDQALVLCNRKGELMGHLAIVKNGNETRIKWEAGADGVELAKIPNQRLKEFAESLIESNSKPRLLELLNVIDKGLERIRPSAARRDTILVGRPLALVSASVGLEVFGKAWTNPHKPPVEGSAPSPIDALQVRVNLGYAHSIEDGLVGYFNEGEYNRIVVPQLSTGVAASNYIRDPKVDGLRVGFGAPKKVTLLMDPWGSIQAACGLVPAKTITLAHPDLNRIVAQMEASFRVGPVLLAADRLALPTPTGNKGTWNFAGPQTGQNARAVIALDPKYFSDQPIIATEGRLLLLNEE